MQTDVEEEQERNPPSRWSLIRDVAVFQVKLLFDGLRDLLLVPISLGAGLVSLFRSGAAPGTEFYDLLRYGKRSEQWINLFGAAEYHKTGSSERDIFPAEDIDKLVAKVETFVVAEYHKGGVTAQAKDRLDRAIDTLHRMGQRKDDAEQ